MYHSVPGVRAITFVNEGNTAGYVDVGRTCTLYTSCSDQTIGKAGGIEAAFTKTFGKAGGNGATCNWKGWRK